MLNSENNRFPNSAELFLLCKEILNIKNARGEKVTDQEVGSLLDFDPADCTHWKYGRKNIKSIHSLKQIADKLGVDARALADVVQGRVNLMDTLHDYKTYGSFECDNSTRMTLQTEAQAILMSQNICTLPIFLPELVQAFPNITVRAQEAQDNIVEESVEDGIHIVSWQKKLKLCGSLRFLVTQKVSRLYLEEHQTRLNLTHGPSEGQYNLFALFLLMPTHLLQVAGCQRDPAKDFFDQFSQFFWLTRSLVNIRLQDYFQHKN